MKKRFLVSVFILIMCTSSLLSQSVLIEAESFNYRGGWVNDQQSIDIMGSAYLMAHGLGVPVEDAHTYAHITGMGEYRCGYVHVTGLRPGILLKVRANSG